MLYAESDLLEVMTKDRLHSGRHLLEEVAPFTPDVRHGGEMITALLRAEGVPDPVRVYLRLRRGTDGALSLHAECSCRQSGCAHVPAVLLRALEWSLENDAGVGAEEAADRLLLYELGPTGENGFTVTPRLALRTEAGQRVIGAYLPRRGSGPLPKFVTALDQSILQRLESYFTGRREEPYAVAGKGAPALLEALITSGRCFLLENTEPLRWGKPETLAFRWLVDEAGNQRPGYEASRPLVWLNLPAAPYYLDIQQNLCGEFKINLPAKLREYIDNTRQVAPDQVEETQARLERKFPNVAFPPLQRWRHERVEGKRPVPCLRLDRLEVAPYLDSREVALLSFEYDGHRLGHYGVATRLEGETLYEIERKPSSEEDYRGQLLDHGLNCLGYHTGQVEAYIPGRGGDWTHLQASLLPQLEAEGWTVEVADDFPGRLARLGAVRAELQRAGGDDWFSLGLGLEVDGVEIDLAPLLLRLLREAPRRLNPDDWRYLADGDALLLKLDDGRSVGLPLKRLRPILEVLIEFYQGGAVTAEGRIRLDRFRAFRLGELDERSGLEWRGHLEPLRLLEKLRGVQEIPPVAVPEGFRAHLRSYQQQGLNWLQFLREHNLAGVLADDMGLGKTVQALAHILLEKQQGRAKKPSLVIAPTSLMANWRREARQFAPELRVLTLHGPDRQQWFHDIPRHDLVLTTYPLLVRDEAMLKDQQWHLLILDEAQVIKNPKAKAGQIARELKAAHRLCLTGTPMENHLGELWSLFDFLLPGLLGSADEFRRRFRKPVEQLGDSDTATRLARRVRPFLLRRTKEAVVAELPPKTEIVRSIELEGPQRDLYETIRNAVQLRVRDEVARKGLARSSIVILDALLKLRQVCCDPRLVKLERARKTVQSAKLEMLLELLPEMLDDGRRILLFSQFTEMLGLIEEAVKKAKIPYVKLTGQTRDRATPVDRFQNSEVPLFLISLKAGGVGLNLTAADTVIHYDPWWNPAVERQATDRAHRIGQDKPVFVYKLITEGTVEERILALQQRKQELADSLLDRKGASAPQWSEEDLQMLFEPLG